MDVTRFVLSFYKDAAKDFHITRITAPQEALKLHSHNYYQLYYVVSGTLLHYVQAASARLSAGDVFLLPPNVPHYIAVPGGEADFYSMSFTQEFFQSVRESSKLAADFLLSLQREGADGVRAGIALPYEDSTFVETLLGRIHREFSQKQAGQNEIIRSCAAVILSIFARVYFTERAAGLPAEENRQLVMHCIDYIRHHYDQEITLEEMVQLSAMSKTCFCSLFTAMTGTSFKAYLNRCRIEKAAGLLETGERVAAVAFRCGYNDLSTFYRNFRKFKGVSPCSYAARHRSSEISSCKTGDAVR